MIIFPLCNSLMTSDLNWFGWEEHFVGVVGTAKSSQSSSHLGWVTAPYHHHFNGDASEDGVGEGYDDHKVDDVDDKALFSSGCPLVTSQVTPTDLKVGEPD